jgi:hypothetical protein
MIQRNVDNRHIENPIYLAPRDIFGGTHGGSEYLRGFSLSDETDPETHTILIDTADGTFTLTRTYLQTDFATGICVSLGFAKEFPAQTD